MTRPRKRILLYCADERELGVTVFTLKCNLYSPTPCHSVDDILACRHQSFDVGIAIHTLRAGDHEAGVAIETRFPELPLLAVVASKWDMALIEYAATVLRAPSSRELLDAIYVHACRKRSPKAKRLAVAV